MNQLQQWALRISGALGIVGGILAALVELLASLGSGTLDPAALLTSFGAIVTGVVALIGYFQGKNAETARAMAVIARARALNEHGAASRDLSGGSVAIRDAHKAMEEVRGLSL